MPRTLLIAILLYATTLTAFAQTAGVPPKSPLPQPTPHQSIADWPAPAPSEKLPQSNLDIVTIDQPTIRQRCRVREIQHDTITCHAAHHRPDFVYRREAILALIAPPSHENLIGIATAAGLVAATLAASFFVPFAWSLTLRIIAGFLFFAGWAANGVVQDDLAAIGYHDHNNDILLYQRPNTPLTLHLHA
jgi:hypothetical protein